MVASEVGLFASASVRPLASLGWRLTVAFGRLAAAGYVAPVTIWLVLLIATGDRLAVIAAA
ncbi:MAG: hypothetical protein QOF51_1060, partial [Chloroflexota bacterium]|nr:hypothetical protein [Chloroflexota bacterium]